MIIYYVHARKLCTQDHAYIKYARSLIVNCIAVLGLIVKKVVRPWSNLKARLVTTNFVVSCSDGWIWQKIVPILNLEIDLAKYLIHLLL